MKSLILLWKVLAHELGQQCCTSTTLDVQTLERRVEHEGMEFLAISLAAFGKGFEKALEDGVLDPLAFPGFRCRENSPVFLGGFMDRVFNRVDGRLLSEPDKDCIFAIRQLTLMFGKILIDCSEERKTDALNGFVECEQEVRRSDDSTSEDSLEELQAVSELLFHDIFEELDDQILVGEVVGKHGPGVTADKLLGNKKYDQIEWPVRLQRVFPFGEHALPSPRFDYLSDRVNFLEPGAERPVKVILVPKTPKTPRVIAVEPTCQQYMQQGIAEKLVQGIESNSLIRPLIGFTDQSPNQRLAREGSLHGELATLDLSEASDRVSYQHVRVVLHSYPFLFQGVDATRSRKADVLGHGVIPLAKFASMGSALCFPMEACVFLAVIFLGIQDELNRPLTRKDVKSMWGKVRVYGDDLIVPVDCVRSVIRRLESFGFKVNASKSFWNGKFRESCGKDYYDGRDVSVTRVRRVLPSSQTDVPEIISAVSLRNQLYYAGYFATAEYLDEVLLPVMGGQFPVVDIDTTSISFTGNVGSGSPVLGRFSVEGHQAQRHNNRLHQPEVYGWMVKPKPPVSKASGEGALLKYFLKRSELPTADREHLVRQGRPKSVNIRLGWARPY